MVAIAGRAVRLGDNLYIASYRAWGAVEGFEGGVAKVRINGSGGQSRLVRVADGGLISGIRQAW